MNKLKNICPYCKNKNTNLRVRLNFEGYDFLVPNMQENKREWIDCNDCNLAFSLPRLSEEQLIYMYDNYRSESFRGETPDQYFDRITSYKPEKSENYNKVKWIKSFIDNEFNPKEILDIGCGGGVLLYTLKTFFKNSELFGVEPTSNFAELSKRRTGANIINGYFNNKSFENIKFDLITCCQVLEHVQDLKTFVFDIKNSLSENGYLYIEVPDISDFETLPKSHSRFLEPSHLWYFNFKFLSEKLFNKKLNLISSSTIKTIRGRNNLMLLFQKN